MSKFNPNNTNHLTGHYPLFLGQELGLADTVNVTYPELEELYQKQLSQLWNEFEIGLSQDILEMKTLPKKTIAPMKNTIAWQSLADAVASRSISSVLMKHVTNPELEHLINLWSFFETIHNRTYAHIVKQTFDNPVDMIQEVYDNTQVLVRSEIIVKAFDELDALPDNATELEKRVAILKAFTALFALEAIAFISSFSVTFAITNTGVFQGIGKLVEMICKDEMLHVRMGYTILNILKQDGTWKMAMAIAAEDIKAILDSVVNQELDWCDYIFEEGEIVGLTPELLKEFVQFMSLPVYKSLGVDYSYQIVEENPLKYMEKYMDSSMIQVANQEMQSGQYQVNAIIDDTEGLDLDLDF